MRKLRIGSVVVGIAFGVYLLPVTFGTDVPEARKGWDNWLEGRPVIATTLLAVALALIVLGAVGPRLRSLRAGELPKPGTPEYEKAKNEMAEAFAGTMDLTLNAVSSYVKQDREETPAPELELREAALPDSHVLVRYTDHDDPSLGIRFLFPRDANAKGEIELSRGHGREVLWHIELENKLSSAIPRLPFKIIFPAHLIRTIKPLAGLMVQAMTIEDRLVRDGDKGSISLEGECGPIPANGGTVILQFKAWVDFARHIPVHVSARSNETGNVDYYAPIVGVLGSLWH